MKKFFKDNLIIIIIVVLFLATISILGYIFMSRLISSQENIEEKIEFIEQKYQEFSSSSSEISSKRTKLYNEIFNNSYYVDFSSKDETWKTYFNEYYDLIDNVYNNYSETINVCKSYNFIYDSTKQKCDLILKYYEILINNFSIDYNLYNESISKYNTWVDSNQDYVKIDMFTKDKYIVQEDYNKNGEIEHY